MATQTGSIDLKAMKESADIATNTEQYFWFNSVDSGAGEGAGAHITETPQDTFISDPANGGGNVLIDSDSVDVRDGVTVLATFGKDGMNVQTEDSNNNTVEIANLGYGLGNAQGGGTANAPYYTMGQRLSGSSIGNWSCAEGYNCKATMYASHAEGAETEALQDACHSEGYQSVASGGVAHAEGYQTHAIGDYGSHAEGYGTYASEDASHAEGYGTYAAGYYSHTQNQGTMVASRSQTAIGEFNVLEPNGGSPSTRKGSAFIIGNGTDDNSRSNALTVDWSGNVDASGCYMSGGAKIGSNITIKGTGSGTLTNSAQAFALTGSQVINGNAFAYNNTSPNTGCIKCLYAGMVMISAKVRFNASFTANDYFAARAINTTQNVATEYSRMRTPTQVFNGDVILPPMYMNVNANDIIKLQAYNITASRGTLDLANTTLSVQYIAPAL